jgi:FixJ family two-component response regulator
MTSAPPAPLRIAVVDDDPAVRHVLGEVLKDGGYMVRSYEAAAPCIDAVCHGEVDFVFTDINMPEMSGVELLRTVKELREEVEVILMTADARVDSAIQATRWGAVDYLEKPFNDVDAIIALAQKVAERVLQNRHESEVLAQHREDSHQGFHFSGRLEEAALAQTLQVVGTMGRDGVLALDGPPPARIHLRAGCITHAQASGLKGEKALYRLLRMAAGAYRLEPYQPPDGGETLGKPVSVYLLEAMRRKDEFDRISAQLPSLDIPWVMNAECQATLAQLAPWLVIVLADVVRGPTAAAALENSTYFDLDILSGLHYLWQLDAVRPAA